MNVRNEFTKKICKKHVDFVTTCCFNVEFASTVLSIFSGALLASKNVSLWFVPPPKIVCPESVKISSSMMVNLFPFQMRLRISVRGHVRPSVCRVFFRKTNMVVFEGENSLNDNQ